MEAFVVEELGGNFRKTGLPIPTIGSDQVLVRIKVVV
jgi:NADPH:quinone reductase-like Zn-dependent oxidoreductase